MMWNWPLPAFMDGNHVMMGLVQLYLTVIIMIINQKFFINGFKLSLIHISALRSSGDILGRRLSLPVLPGLSEYYFSAGVYF